MYYIRRKDYLVSPQGVPIMARCSFYVTHRKAQLISAIDVERVSVLDLLTPEMVKNLEGDFFASLRDSSY